MTKTEMQVAWALIKKKVFEPEKPEKWINTFNRFCQLKINNIGNLNFRDNTYPLSFRIFHIDPNITDKPTIKIKSLIPNRAFEIELHYDPSFTLESETLCSKKLSKILRTEKDLEEILINYIAHPAIHLHLPEVFEELIDGKDTYHEIRINSSTENFFYLMYQIFFQIIDDKYDRYGNSDMKKVEIKRLSSVIWNHRTNFQPISPGILFPSR
jgi:hypothetical protein